MNEPINTGDTTLKSNLLEKLKAIQIKENTHNSSDVGAFLYKFWGYDIMGVKGRERLNLFISALEKIDDEELISYVQKKIKDFQTEGSRYLKSILQEFMIRDVYQEGEQLDEYFCFPVESAETPSQKINRFYNNCLKQPQELGDYTRPSCT